MNSISGLSGNRYMLQPATFQPVCSEEDDRMSKTEGFWEEINSTYDQEAEGSFYYFRLADSYNVFSDASKAQAIEMKNNELYPAVQAHPHYLVYLDVTTSREKINKELFNYYEKLFENQSIKTSQILLIVQKLVSCASPVLQKLGYEMRREEGNVYLKLPDANIFNHRWKDLQRTYPELPSLRIIPSKRVVGDKDFVDNYLERGISLSMRKEFLHDHTIHIISIVLRIVENGFPHPLDRFSSYKKAENEVKKTIKAWKDRIDEIETQKTRAQADIDGTRAILSVVVDLSTTITSNDFFRINIESTNGIFESVLWNIYLTKRFGENWKARIQPLWMEIKSFRG